MQHSTFLPSLSAYTWCILNLIEWLMSKCINSFCKYRKSDWFNSQNFVFIIQEEKILMSYVPLFLFVLISVFIYSMPGYKCSIKERMLYSSCKSPLISRVEALGIEIAKRVSYTLIYVIYLSQGVYCTPTAYFRISLV